MLERANNKPILYSTVNSVILLHRRTLASPGIYRPSEHSDAAVTRRRILRLPLALSLSLFSVSSSSRRKPIKEVCEIETRRLIFQNANHEIVFCTMLLKSSWSMNNDNKRVHNKINTKTLLEKTRLKLLSRATITTNINCEQSCIFTKCYKLKP